MAGQIRVAPEQMRMRACECRTEAENVEAVIGRMDRLIDALQGEWEGEASRAYASRFSDLRPSFVKARDLIDEIARSLDHAANMLEETDAHIAAIM